MCARWWRPGFTQMLVSRVSSAGSIPPVATLEQALVAGKILAYAQGFAAMQAASSAPAGTSAPSPTPGCGPATVAVETDIDPIAPGSAPVLPAEGRARFTSLQSQSQGRSPRSGSVTRGRPLGVSSRNIHEKCVGPSAWLLGPSAARGTIVR